MIDVLLLEGMVNGHKPPQGQITVSTVSPTRVYVRLFDLDVFLNNHINNPRIVELLSISFLLSETRVDSEAALQGYLWTEVDCAL